MRRVERGKVECPSVITTRGANELRRAEGYYSINRGKAFPFTVYRDSAVKDALERLFFGKCAYCESPYGPTQPVDVEHYRPKGAVEGINHGGYWWLAMDWDNLLPSCIDCNRRRTQKVPSSANGIEIILMEDGEFDRTESLQSGKEASFPLIGGVVRAIDRNSDLDAERRLLLDPTRDNPDEHLVFFSKRDQLISLVYPRALQAAELDTIVPAALMAGEPLAAAAKLAGVSPMGAASVRIYGLNRLSLVQARTKVLRDLEFLLELATSLTELLLKLCNRMEIKANDLVGSTDAVRSESLRSDIEFDKHIVTQLKLYIDQTKEQMRSMTLPRAPYSRVALAWIDACVKGNRPPNGGALAPKPSDTSNIVRVPNQSESSSGATDRVTMTVTIDDSIERWSAK